VSADQVERKLAAIFAADVEGYSRLMGVDEVGTLRTLTAYRVVMDGLIARHRGRIVSTAGDICSPAARFRLGAELSPVSALNAHKSSRPSAMALRNRAQICRYKGSMEAVSTGENLPVCA
jgi:class 3 adenylate cyclase